MILTVGSMFNLIPFHLTCSRGKETLKLRVTKGGPLPFAFDILAPTFAYGDKCFIKYPAELPDYFKQAFPEGFTYHRKMSFEDGGCATATVEMRLAVPKFKS